MIKNILILSLLFTNVQASSFITCDLNVEVLSLKKNIANIIVIKVKQGNSGFGDCQFSPGNQLEVKIKNAEILKQRKKAIIRYNKYSGMGPKGPMGGTTWTLAP